MLRALILRGVGETGYAPLIQEARTRFVNHRENKQSLVADLQETVYSLVASNSLPEDYETLRNLSQNAELAEERNRALRALGNVRTAELIKQTLEMTLSGAVRDQDLFQPLINLRWTVAGREMAWKFFQDNIHEFEKRLGSGQFLMARIVSLVTAHFVTQEKSHEILKFFDAFPVPVAARTIKQSVESININANILNRNRQEVAEWLNKVCPKNEKH